MKHLMKFGLYAMFFATLFITACGDDPDNPIVDTDPEVSIEVGDDYQNQVYEPGHLLGPIVIKFTKGTHDLNVAQILRNGEPMEAGWDLQDEDGNVLNVDPTEVISFNDDQTEEAVLNFVIELSDEERTDEYTFEVADIESNTATSDPLSFTTEAEETGTAFSYQETGRLLNQGGPAGTGGLDLDTGNRTGSADAEAEIRDLGINTDLPVEENWIQKFAGANGSEIVKLDDDLDLSTLEYVEDLENAFLEGSIVAETPVVAVNDAYIVRKGDQSRYYLLLVTSINITPDNNDDYYEFTVTY